MARTKAQQKGFAAAHRCSSTASGPSSAPSVDGLKSIQSDFVLLDVKRGRQRLRRHLDNGGARVPVFIRGFVTGVWGRDDGISQEFEVAVTAIEIVPQPERVSPGDTPNTGPSPNPSADAPRRNTAEGEP